MLPPVEVCGRVDDQAQGGKIINVASVGGYKGTPIYPSYGVSKGGLLQLTRCLAIELAPHNIQVNSLAPGWTTTDMTDWIRNDPNYAVVKDEMITITPACWFAEPSEMAERQYSGLARVGFRYRRGYYC